MALELKPKYDIRNFKLSDLNDDNSNKKIRNLIIDVAPENVNIAQLIKALNNSLECSCVKYDYALSVNALIDKGLVKTKKINLIDDHEMRDRSYIDTTIFKNTTFIIPFNYIMWNIKFGDEIPGYKYTKEQLSEIERIVSMISNFPEPLTDIEKLILLSNYVQAFSEYIWFKTDELHKTEERFELLENALENEELLKRFCHSFGTVGSNPFEVLIDNYGCCEGIANLMTLLCNNPYMRINCSKVNGDGHAWNYVLLNGKLYQMDITRSITYSPYRAKDNLKTLMFNSEYLLFGESFSELVNHEKIATSTYLPQELSKDDFDKDYINVAIEHLKNTGIVQFDYSNIPIRYKRKSSSMKR